MLETVFAAAVLLVCGALLVRLLLPPARRQAIDRRLHGVWQGLSLLVKRGWQRRPRQWLQKRRTQREAQEVIERARRRAAGSSKVAREGNVYRPDSFKPPTDRDTLH
jgi:hypothetical protein